MTALTPQLALLFVLTTGAAAVMTRLSYRSKLLRVRIRKCAACGHHYREKVCPRCTD